MRIGSGEEVPFRVFQLRQSHSTIFSATGEFDESLQPVAWVVRRTTTLWRLRNGDGGNLSERGRPPRGILRSRPFHRADEGIHKEREVLIREMVATHCVLFQARLQAVRSGPLPDRSLQHPSTYPAELELH